MKPLFLRTEAVGRGEDGQVRGPRGGGRQAQQQCQAARPEVPQEGGCGGEAGREVRRGGESRDRDHNNNSSRSGSPSPPPGSYGGYHLSYEVKKLM